MEEATKVVEEIGAIKFEGNIIPHAWYQTIRTKTSQGSDIADVNAILILAEIVYWYRPRHGFDDVSGMPGWNQKKFAADKLQLGYADIAGRLGLTKRQVMSAVSRLVAGKLITREFRTITNKTSRKIPNVMFVEPNLTRLREVTFPSPENTGEHGTVDHQERTTESGTLVMERFGLGTNNLPCSVKEYPLLYRGMQLQLNQAKV